MKSKIFLLFITCAHFGAFAQKDYNILNYGAKVGFGDTSTAAIQKAIDAAAGKGGGKVVIPAGNFVTGPLNLKSGVKLYLADDAVLYGSSPVQKP